MGNGLCYAQLNSSSGGTECAAEPLHSLIVKALRRFTVRPQLPEPLEPLGALIRNLRWSWHPASQDLFADIDPALWASFEGDPLKLLGAVSVSRLQQLAKDQSFLDRVHGLAADLNSYLTEPRWYQGQIDRAADEGKGAVLPNAIAYFSMEFGVSEVLAELLRRTGESWRATTSSRPPTWGCRSSASGCCTGSGTSGSRCPRTAGSRSTTWPTTRRGCRSTGCWAPTASRWSSRSRCPEAGPCPPGSGRPTSGGCRCCCWTRTSRPTTTSCGPPPTGSTAATRITGSSRNCCWASAASARSTLSARSPGTPGPRSST